MSHSLLPGLTVKGVAKTWRAKQQEASKTSLGWEKNKHTKTEEHCQETPDAVVSHGSIAPSTETETCFYAGTYKRVTHPG